MAWQARSMPARLARRPTLTASARDDVSEPRVGTKKRAFRSNKETDEGQKMRRFANSLTKKAPYKENSQELKCTAWQTMLPTIFLMLVPCVRSNHSAV